MATATITFTNMFEDDTKAKISVGPVESTAINTATLKAQVKEFNSNIGTNGFATKMLSSYGAAWKGISAVTVTVTDRNYLF